MPAHRIHPPPSVPEIKPHQIAALLKPMPVHRSTVEAAQASSDEAVQMALDAGVPINAAYRFQQQRRTDV